MKLKNLKLLSLLIAILLFNGCSLLGKDYEGNWKVETFSSSGQKMFSDYVMIRDNEVKNIDGHFKEFKFHEEKQNGILVLISDDKDFSAKIKVIEENKLIGAFKSLTLHFSRVE